MPLNLQNALSHWFIVKHLYSRALLHLVIICDFLPLCTAPSSTLEIKKQQLCYNPTQKKHLNYLMWKMDNTVIKVDQWPSWSWLEGHSSCMFSCRDCHLESPVCCSGVQRSKGKPNPITEGLFLTHKLQGWSKWALTNHKEEIHAFQ